MTKPWADPDKPLDERLVLAEAAIANVDTVAARCAIMRELVEGAIVAASGIAEDMGFDAIALRIRALLADAPAR